LRGSLRWLSMDWPIGGKSRRGRGTHLRWCCSVMTVDQRQQRGDRQQSPVASRRQHGSGPQKGHQVPRRPPLRHGAARNTCGDRGGTQRRRRQQIGDTRGFASVADWCRRAREGHKPVWERYRRRSDACWPLGRALIRGAAGALTSPSQVNPGKPSGAAGPNSHEPSSSAL
jgi:hypothetical protein